MEEKFIDRLIGRYCKIVTREPGEDRVHVIHGKLITIDYDAELLVVESKEGLGCLNIKTIEAIKPRIEKT